MALIRGRITGDLLLEVNVEITAPYGYAAPKPTRNVRGLVDTGAQRSCVLPGTFQDMGLQPDSETAMVGSPGHDDDEEAATTTVELVLRGDGEKGGVYRPSLIQLIVHRFSGTGFEILIGADILELGELVANYPLGWWTLALPDPLP